MITHFGTERAAALLHLLSRAISRPSESRFASSVAGTSHPESEEGPCCSNSRPAVAVIRPMSMAAPTRPQPVRLVQPRAVGTVAPDAGEVSNIVSVVLISSIIRWTGCCNP